MKGVLATADVVAMLMLSAMSDLEGSTRLLVAAALALNLLLLVGGNALATRSARWGAVASLAGYAGTVGFWLVMALACGIEYFNARCDAVVTPLIAFAVVVSLGGLPAGRLGGLFVKR
jgi:hypothetical protein